MFFNHNFPPLISLTLAFMAGICAAHCTIHCWWLLAVSVLLMRNLRDGVLILLACGAGLMRAQLPMSRPKYQPPFAEKLEVIAHRCQTQLSPQTHELFSLIFLGKPSRDAREQRDLFGYWGIAHQLARSGLHLVILLMLMRYALGFVPLWYGAKLFITLLLVAGYALLSWPSVSFIRACMTCGLYAIFELALIPVSALQVVTLVTLAVLVQNPIHLFFLDFQLSFGLTFALAMMGHVRRIV